MDYELGAQKLTWKYWEQREKGVPHEQLVDRQPNPLWEVLQKALAGE